MTRKQRLRFEKYFLPFLKGGTVICGSEPQGYLKLQLGEKFELRKMLNQSREQVA